jgi:hypothetical protein
MQLVNQIAQMVGQLHQACHPTATVLKECARDLQVRLRTDQANHVESLSRSLREAQDEVTKRR